MAIFKYFPRILFFLLFTWISLIPLPLQCRFPVQLKIFFLTGFLFLWVKSGRSFFRNGDWSLWLWVAALSFNLYRAVFPVIAVSTYWDLVIPLIFIHYLIAENFSKKEEFVFLARTICIFSLIVALWGLMDVLLRVNFLYEKFLTSPFYDNYKHVWPMRAIATQFHAPPLGTYLIAGLPFSILTLKQDRSLYKVLGVLGVIVIPVTAILTFSRGVFLSFFCVILLVLLFKKKMKWGLSIVIGLVIFTLFAEHLKYPFSKFGANIFFIAGDGIFTSYRFERIQMLGRILADQPLWGIGLQHVRPLFFSYFSGAELVEFDYKIMDNMYLTLAAETGLVGLVTFFVFLGSMIAKGCRSFQGCRGNEVERVRLFYVGAGFLALLINAAAYELFYWPSQYMLFCIYVGLIEAFSRGHALPAQAFGEGEPKPGNVAKVLSQ